MKGLAPAFLILLSLFPLAARSAGTVISVELEATLSPEQINEYIEPLFEGFKQPAAQYSVDIYWVEYTSLYPDGEEAVITSQVFLPRYSDRDKRSVYVFGAGSTGLRDSCRPSREHIMGIRWGLYRSHVLAHAGQGSIGVLPDYMGFGDPDRLQYYMVAESEARVLLDAFRAVNNFLDQEKVDTVSGTSRFVAGFSQGGHAAFAAADYSQTYAPELPLHGVIGYGPTTDIFSLFREYSDVAPMVLFTYSRLYGNDQIDPSWVLLDEFADSLEKDLMRMCVGGMQSFYPQVPQGLFKEEFITSLTEGTIKRDYPSLYRHIESNSTGLSGQTVPTVIYQGKNDIVIHPETQRDFADKLIARGVPLDYVYYENARHDTRQISFDAARKWIDNHTN